MGLRAVLDEAVPKKLAALLRDRGCDVSPFPPRWKGAKNGQLLGMVEAAGFEALLTCDKSIRHQQSFRSRRIALVVLPDQALPALLPIIDPIASGLLAARPGAVVVIDRSGRATLPPIEA